MCVFLTVAFHMFWLSTLWISKTTNIREQSRWCWLTEWDISPIYCQMVVFLFWFTMWTWPFGCLISSRTAYLLKQTCSTLRRYWITYMNVTQGFSTTLENAVDIWIHQFAVKLCKLWGLLLFSSFLHSYSFNTNLVPLGYLIFSKCILFPLDIVTCHFS